MRSLTPEEYNETWMWVYEGGSVMSDYVMGNIEGGLAWRSARGEKLGQDSPIMIQDQNISDDGKNKGRKLMMMQCLSIAIIYMIVGLEDSRKFSLKKC